VTEEHFGLFGVLKAAGCDGAGDDGAFWM